VVVTTEIGPILHRITALFFHHFLGKEFSLRPLRLCGSKILGFANAWVSGGASQLLSALIHF
jgi:hypothetical protein